MLRHICWLWMWREDLTRIQHDRTDELFLGLMEGMETGTTPDDIAVEELAREIETAREEKGSSIVLPLVALILVCVLAVVGYRQWTIAVFRNQVDSVRSMLNDRQTLAADPLRVEGDLEKGLIVVAGLAPPEFDADAFARTASQEIAPQTRLEIYVSRLATLDSNHAISNALDARAASLSETIAGIEAAMQ